MPESFSKRDILFAKLKAILDDQSHLFACGGQIPILAKRTKCSLPPHQTGSEQVEEQNQPRSSDSTKTSDPVAIRWDVRETRHTQLDSLYYPCDKLTLPLCQGREADLARLVQDSQPATFGRSGKDVYDESYRKAIKMEPTAFCTTFDPYSLGIIDTVAQMLLPSTIDSVTNRGVQAELYKLNVYSSPSGKFKSHVDTPRSRLQFGSLVICLPVQHQGGQLKVRHKGEEMTFDWSTDSNTSDCTSIHWAAFYSDCEHEVLEVTSGHRVTLTYNLYTVRGVGRLTGMSPILNPAHLPLFQQIQAFLAQDPFSSKGGTLGFWCSHVYAYNHKSETPLPDNLKGVDAVLWEIFQALGLYPKIAPVMKMDDSIREEFSEWYNDPNPPTYPWAIRRQQRLPSEMPSEWIVGHDFGVCVDDTYQAESLEDYHNIYQRWGGYSREHIHWLTTPKQAELQLVYTAYGNEARAEAMYSHCAILVNISPKGSN
ncbi:oxidoreductase [Mariannaea sp. PMI_226]|nr:oxidoreductase [Mariannaea sp. PMI_226]